MRLAGFPTAPPPRRGEELPSNRSRDRRDRPLHVGTAAREAPCCGPGLGGALPVPPPRSPMRSRQALPVSASRPPMAEVSIPVELLPATRGDRVTLRLLAPDGTPLV